jgi:hypothetical protein
MYYTFSYNAKLDLWFVEKPGRMSKHHIYRMELENIKNISLWMQYPRKYFQK